MKFTNTKSQIKEVGTATAEWGKATWNLTKAVVKVPVAVGKDVSTAVKEAREMRALFNEVKARKEMSVDEIVEDILECEEA